jgi:hypothetical protein
MFVRCCHCKDCQRQTGSAFAVNALVEADRIELLRGTPQRRALPRPAADGRTRLVLRRMRHHAVERLRCPQGDAVRAGRGALPPDVHIFTRSRLPWVELSGGAPGFEVYHDMAALWPAESLRRREALLGKGR